MPLTIVQSGKSVAKRLGQSEDGKNNTDGTDAHGEDGGPDLDTGSRTTVTTCGSVVRTGSSGGLAAGSARAMVSRRRRLRATGGGESGVDSGRGIGDTVGRCRDLGLVWHGGDGTQRFIRLSVGLDLTAGIGVDAWIILVVTLAGLESTVLSIIGGIVGTSDAVVDVLAETSGVRTSRVASLEAENVAAHEVVPFDDLLVSGVAAIRPGGGIEETTEGVTTEVGTVGVEFSSKVVGGKVDVGLVDETDDLDVVGGPHELNTLEGASRDETRSVTGLGAPGDFLLLRLTDSGGTGGRCPKAEI